MHIPDADSFMSLLLEILQLHPEGLGEYALLQHLRGDARSGFASIKSGNSDNSGNSEDLFRTHFLLFHFLYRLRDQLRAAQAGDMEIHTLSIRCHATPCATQQGLTSPDPLRSYYLDLSQLDTTRADIDAMLGRFWTRFSRYDRRGEALSVLELSSDADAAAILQQYRRLAMQHHPDRGGDASKLQAIHAAMTILDPRKQAES